MSRRYRIGIFLALILLLAGCGGTPAGQASSPGAATETPRVAQVVTPALATIEPTSVPVTAPAPTPVPTSAPAPTLVPVTSTPTEPVPTAEPTSAPQVIVIGEPAAGTLISSPVTVRGSTNFWPFEANLTGQIKDASGAVLGVTGVHVDAPDIGQGGPFTGEISFTPPATEQQGTLEIIEYSAEDGSVHTIQTINVRLAAQSEPAPAPNGVQLDAPKPGEGVTLPVHIALHGALPNEPLVARFRFDSGTQIEESLEVVVGTDGIGYAVGNLNFNTESSPGPFGPGPASLEIASTDGTVVANAELTVLPDENTQAVEIAWVPNGGGEEMIVFQQRVPSTPQIASAALRELLNGPQDGNLAGAETALPTFKEIVTYPDRTPDWGYEVQLLKLVITDGVATANFSKEMRAYGGGAARVQMIRQQIERTLRQFPSVREVVIQIEGQSDGVLEP